jgi:2-oxoglutarate dehydrogenase E1 component
MDQFSYIANAEPAYIESLYHTFKQNPAGIDAEWKKFFEGFDFAQTNFSTNGQANSGGEGVSGQNLVDELKVYNLILAYREKGHLIATTNPLKPRKDRHANLKLEQLGFTEADLSRSFSAAAALGIAHTSLKDIIAHLEAAYCRNMGFEYDYIIEPIEKKWFQDRIEKQAVKFNFSTTQKQRILKKLNETVVFEQFLDKKYIGQKRFSLEGGESTIAGLDAIINRGADLGVQEFVFGMAHRGRLNVLANILGKTYSKYLMSSKEIQFPIQQWVMVM